MSRHEYEYEEPYVVVERHDGPSVASFLVGLAVGAGVALLVAPRSGVATRRGIQRRANRVRHAAEQAVTDVTDGVADTFDAARRRVEDQIETARRAIDLKRQQVNRAMEAGRRAAQEARGELEQRIAETKAAHVDTPAVDVNLRGSVAVGESVELDEG